MKIRMSLSLYAVYFIFAVLIAVNIVLPVYGGDSIVNVNPWGVIDIIIATTGVLGCAGILLQPVSKSGNKTVYSSTTPILPIGIFRGLQLAWFYLFGGTLNVVMYAILCSVDVILIVAMLVDKSLYSYESESEESEVS